MVSAIILSYNRCHEVLKTIEKLKSYREGLSFELEIIVVDNASADGTSSEVHAKHPDITLIKKETNNGIAGWNEGFKAANYDYFLVLDDDSHIYSGLTEAVTHMEKNPDIGILALQIKDEDMGLDPDLDPEDAWKDNEDIVGFIGCGAIIRKELYKKIGGYAEWIYVYTHEFEYAIRCLEAGYRVNFFVNGVVIHRVSHLNRSSKRMRTFATRNEMAIVFKYFRNYRTKFIIRTLVNNLKFMRREGFRSGLYVLTGFLKFLKLSSQLNHTPVSEGVQKFYAENFWSAKPIFNKKKQK